MIKSYDNGNVITDGNLNSATAISAVRFSFPYQNYSDLRVLEQDFVVRSEHYSRNNLGTSHSEYPTAKLVSESNFSNMAGGLLRFTRKYLIFANRTYAFPKTSNITFPAIKYDLALDDATFANPRDITNARDNITKVVSCEERISFVDLSESSSFDSIPINSKFSPQLTFTFTDPVAYLFSQTDEQQTINDLPNPVDFVAFNTTPNVSEYIGMIENETMIQVEDTKISNYMGNVYKITELFTKTQ